MLDAKFQASLYLIKFALVLPRPRRPFTRAYTRGDALVRATARLGSKLVCHSVAAFHPAPSRSPVPSQAIPVLLCCVGLCIRCASNRFEKRNWERARAVAGEAAAASAGAAAAPPSLAGADADTAREEPAVGAAMPRSNPLHTVDGASIEHDAGHLTPRGTQAASAALGVVGEASDGLGVSLARMGPVSDEA